LKLIPIQFLKKKKKKRLSIIKIEENKTKEENKENKETTIIDNNNNNNYTGETQKCGVCLENKPIHDFFKAPCNHNYCNSCLETHYKIKTQDANVLKVQCIEPKCLREITEEESKFFLKRC